MKYEKLSNALNEISDVHIAEAAASKKKVKPAWLGAVAAVLVLAILVTTIGRPTTASATGLIAAPTYPEMVQFSEDNWEAWGESQHNQYSQPRDYAQGTEVFFKESIPEFLTGSTENRAFSPLNVYIALAMLAQTSGGESRQQLLDLLGSDGVESLRTQADYMWNAHYRNDGLATSVLASSLWLDDAYSYEENTVNLLSDNYYASVYRGDLGSREMNTALQSWLNEQTGGLLKSQADGVEMGTDTLLALATTIYYNAPWTMDFNEVNNYAGLFHAPDGDVEVTYMYQHLSGGPYYWGEDFSAVVLPLADDSQMWLILPNEGYTPEDLLESGHALSMVLDSTAREYENQSYPCVKLSLPKFDIVSDMDLIPGLQALGVTRVFDHITADFSPLFPEDTQAYVSEAKHAARIAVDEDGVLAAAYTVIMKNDGAAADMQVEEIDFILDRPFLFLIESHDGIPLFAGVVNNP